MTRVLGLLGMPGAGKTTAFETLTSTDDFTGIQMKSIASEEFNQMQDKGLEVFSDETASEIQEQGLEDEATPDGDIGDEIADWVDTILSVNESYFAEKAGLKISSMENSETVVVDGIRSVADVEHISRASDHLQLVFLHTPFSTRLERLKDRGRSGEENIDAQYLINRDEQELSWGVDDILSTYESEDYQKQYQVEFFYANHNSVSQFKEEFVMFVDDLLNIES